MAAAPAAPRGRGIAPPVARLLSVLALLGASACERAEPPPTRVLRSSAAAKCATLPDTATEIRGARADRNDIPNTRLELDAACPRITVLTQAGARIPLTYRVFVDSGQTLVVRARAESGGLALGLDAPGDPRPDFSNVGALREDSLVVRESRDVLIRITYTPRLRDEPRSTRILLTALARP